MTMKYIRDRYGVPAKRGGRVRYSGSTSGETYDGTITSAAANAHLRVRFDTDTWGRRPVHCHPTWKLEYLEPTK